MTSSSSQETAKSRTLTVGLVGNPNCGKTSLFNQLAKTHASVGNYPRVTVELQEKGFDYKGWTIQLVDLPGLYSLSSHAPEERIARDFLRAETADVLINVLDAGNLDRSLFLTTQLLELGQRNVFALNMIDEARSKGISVKTDDLSSMLGGPVVETAAVAKEGLDALLDAVIRQSEVEHDEIRITSIPYDRHLMDAIGTMQEQLQEEHRTELDQHQSRWLAIKLLEGDEELTKEESDHPKLIEQVRQSREELEKWHGETCESMFARARYGFINGMLQEVRTLSAEGARADKTPLFDGLLLHRFLGLPSFLLIMWLMFETTFTLGALPADWIESGVDIIKDVVGGWISPGLFHDLMLDGVITGMGAVIVFLPYIVILFFFIAFFSETGYLARASFLLDRLMHLFGLHGKAFIPLVMGFGCNVPAVMATRTIESPKARMIAILVNPFMSCAQRLPAFILLTGAFFAEWAGRAIFSMYMISIATAMGSAVLLSKLVFKGGTESFVMELPPYRLPALSSILYHMWDKAWDFVRMVGGVIVVGSVIIWFLQAFPAQVEDGGRFETALATLEAQAPGSERDQAIVELKREQEQLRLEQSYLGRFGQTISPIFAPLGFDWKDSVAIVTGFFAKEVVVASYAVLYAQDDEVEDGSEGLRIALRNAMDPVTAFALMVFLLTYAPCLSTMAAIKREAGGWKWAGFSMVFSLSIGWMLAYITVTIGNLIV
ncbi:MAG: ferrous iron transport protein B [Magnetococcales bacterium]|nr:ferrous iron transport protein B [Magnetococcales bacterium]